MKDLVQNTPATRRVMPGLLLSNNRIVKGQRFESHEYVGDPINVLRIFNEKQVEEIVIYDISASKKNEIALDLLEEMAAECFMPMTYGGGIRSIEDCDRIFSIGVEKVSLNSAILTKSKLLSDVANKYGSQSISATIDYKIYDNLPFVYDHVNRQLTNIKVKEQMLRYEDSGVGEVILSSVEQDGTLDGINLGPIRELAESTCIPVLACGGTNSIKDISSIFDYGFSGVVVGSFFIYHGPHRAVLIDVPTY